METTLGVQARRPQQKIRSEIGARLLSRFPPHPTPPRIGFDQSQAAKAALAQLRHDLFRRNVKNKVLKLSTRG